MGYKIKVTFAEGVTNEQINEVIRNMGGDPTKPAEGNISHEVTSENGRLVFIDEWESKEVFDNFNNNMARPMLQQAGIPEPKVEEL